MLEFTDGDYTVRIRHNQRARQVQRDNSATNNNAGELIIFFALVSCMIG